MATSVTYHLNGGPWHGRKIALDANRDHFHLLEPVEEAISRALQAPSLEEGIEVVKTREGTYSVIRGYPGEMEWDGWVSHD